jgi:phosphoglycolate phosphatase
MKSWTIVFDLDGTLVDTAPDLAAATNYVLSTLSLAPVDEIEIRNFVGHGALAMIEGALKSQGRTLPQRELYDLFEVFIAHYTANIAAHSAPFPNAIATLQAMANEGAVLAVCTNKIEAHARALLDALDLSQYFAAITGRDSVGAYKPDPKHLTETIARAAGLTERAVMIGDSETDIRTAKAAGVPIVAVDFGYSTEPVRTFGPDLIISNFSELPGAVRKLTNCPV